jgi:hypothetical protein
MTLVESRRLVSRTISTFAFSVSTLRSFRKRPRLPTASVPAATFVVAVLRQADANPAQSAMVVKP